jgi:hypothetical protein
MLFEYILFFNNLSELLFLIFKLFKFLAIFVRQFKIFKIFKDNLHIYKKYHYLCKTN